jgi:DNA-binding NtrC family response regulator
LFGYEEGAFTGAKKGGKPGKFEIAQGGTLFLDEINSMPIEMQVKLLRVLQDGEITRIGGVKSIPVNVRVIAASNEPLETLIQKGEFREDLYYRLGVVVIQIPPLRERLEDIPLLFTHLLSKIAKRLGLKEVKYDQSLLSSLKTYHWPGNIRELENYIERAVPDGLRTSIPGELTFPIIQRYVDDIVLVDEHEIKQAFILILTRMKQVIEPSAAVSVAAAKSKNKYVAAIASRGNINTLTMSL